MVKVILQLYPVVYAESEEERKALRPLGRNRERVHDALIGMPDIVRACDEMGVWGVSCIEHHFHSEGYEVGPNIGVHNGYWAAITKNVRIGNLGYSISAGDPIRVAEETAILDHLTEGRSFVGFARGYQNRWTNVLGQKLGAVATMSDKSEADARNREIFEEQVEVVMKAWKNDAFDHKGKVWEYPYPHDEGVKDWFMGEVTREMGAPGEMDEDGVLRKISVVPAPYTDPHPPVFIASNASIETVEYAGARGFIPAYFSSVGKCAHFGPTYTKVANENGFNFVNGQNQAIVRWPHIGATTEEGRQLALDWSGDIFRNFYGPLFPDWADRRKTAFGAELLEAMDATGLFQAGSVSDVRDEYVSQWKQLPAEYIVLIYHYAQAPKQAVIDNLKIFMDEVKPALDELADYPPERAAAE
jgi:alkanesulfonate monooxygenase SsuD/methylene tetrahydromethanopterin reductase-like flavin-dependent oxidoreductase (luciferase family)